MNIIETIQADKVLEHDPWTTKNRAGIPYGSWMSDTFSGADIYSMGFDRVPTVFFDPQASTSRGNGTYRNPFHTTAELNAWVSANPDKKGQVLGFKRGSKLLGGWSGSTVGLHSSDPSAPFLILPYGDAEQMPIISAGTVYAETGNAATGWANTAGDTGGDARVWKVALAVEADVFDQSYPAVVKRIWKINHDTTTSETDAVGALITAGSGNSIFYSGILYIYPFAGKPDWTQIEVMSATDALYLNITDAPVTGNMSVLGLHIRGSVNNAFSWYLAGLTTSPVIENVAVIGCKCGQAGADKGGGSTHAVIIAGGGVSIVSNAQFIGNRFYDSLNGTGAMEAVSSGEVWGNHCSNTGVKFEQWGSVSGVKIHDNYAYGSRGQRQAIYNIFFDAGYRNFGVVNTGIGTITGPSITDSAKNVGNEFYRNILLNIAGTYGVNATAQGTLVYNNTFEEGIVSGSGDAILLQDDTTSHTVSADIQNNIFIGTGTSGNCRFFNAAAGTTYTSKTNTLYLPGGNYLNYVNGVSSVDYGYTGSLANFNVAAETAGSYSAMVDPQMAADGYTPTNTIIFNSAQVLPGYNERDCFGRPTRAGGDLKPGRGAVARP